jgi:hypothetical protein
MTSWTFSFLRFARPHTVSMSGASSGEPSGSWMPREARKSRAPFSARLAVHQQQVVGSDFERPERFAHPLLPLLQKLVEHFLPGLRVHFGCGSEHAVHVEKHGIEAIAGNNRLDRQGNPFLRPPYRERCLLALAEMHFPALVAEGQVESFAQPVGCSIVNESPPPVRSRGWSAESSGLPTGWAAGVERKHAGVVTHSGQPVGHRHPCSADRRHMDTVANVSADVGQIHEDGIAQVLESLFAVVVLSGDDALYADRQRTVPCGQGS